MLKIRFRSKRDLNPVKLFTNRCIGQLRKTVTLEISNYSKLNPCFDKYLSIKFFHRCKIDRQKSDDDCISFRAFIVDIASTGNKA